MTKQEITATITAWNMYDFEGFVRRSRKILFNIPKKIVHFDELYYWMINTKQFNRNKKEDRIKFWKSLKRMRSVYVNELEEENDKNEQKNICCD